MIDHYIDFSFTSENKKRKNAMLGLRAPPDKPTYPIQGCKLAHMTYFYFEH